MYLSPINFKGKIAVCLTIDKMGEMVKYNLINSIKNCPECAQEAIRLVKSIPKWQPALSYQDNGTKVPYTEKLVVEIEFKK